MNIIKNFIEQHGITEQQLIDGYKQGLQIILENASKISKQETLEEAAERFYPINSNSSAMEMLDRHQLNNSYKQEGFIAGANWQSERMYSEEDIDILSELIKDNQRKWERFDNKLIKEKPKSFDEIFEQLKKLKMSHSL